MPKGDVTLTLKADVANAIMRLTQVANASTKMEKSFGKGVRKGDKALKRYERFGQAAGKQITGLVASYASLGAVIATVTGAFTSMHAEAMRGAQAVRENYSSMASLLQMSRGDPEVWKRMSGSAFGHIRAGLTKADAFRLQQALESAGMQKYGPQFAKLHGIIPELPGTIGAMAKMRAGMPGQIPDPIRLLNQAMIAQAPASDVYVQQLLTAAPLAASGVNRIGGTPEELMAAMGTMSQTFTPEMSATSIARFADWASKTGLGDKGLVAAVEATRAQNLTAQQLLKQMPETRARRFFEFVTGTHPISGVSNLATLKRLLREQQAVSSGAPGMIGGMINIAETGPILGPERQRLRAAGELEVRRMTRWSTREQQEWDELIDRTIARMDDQGADFFLQWLMRKQLWWQRKVLRRAPEELPWDYAWTGVKPSAGYMRDLEAHRLREAVEQNTEAQREGSHTARMTQSE